MTPHELRLCVHARNELQTDERRRDLWTAWHTAYLHRVEKFPHLNELMPKLLAKADKADEPDPAQVNRDLMNALLQFRSAPPPPKKSEESKSATVAEMNSTVVPDPPPASVRPEGSEVNPHG